ncbi:sugar ABC transporter ATP-binding protein [Tranquillimonas alkanivorans]|uniref:Monosaccharide ABC transporter ATP-binding protein, CUT2 family n=1 Tax=Tranquillimonas alkanivorans TaxID=441119 RepID=A0A1I5NSD4_9RHOB|nr:sugar ABC transporter ATP-binding protein [Tranquillimonas alkanivorans]SFP24682.1 monosaccharide ABC transporter ATP-binding protein, CUT2 family [Tranquillimonas alkanivorans]
MTDAPPILALDAVSRRFGPVQVLFDVDFSLRAGEVHALIGENGAGKSTTMKILAGYLEASEGRILLDGQPIRFASSEGAEDAGIVMIHQEFNLAEQLTVEQNVFLGREKRKGLFLDHRAMQAETRVLLDRLQCKVAPKARVSDISVPDKQMVEIAKALSRDARVLIMDEPTAVLTNREAEVLFAQIERLRAAGVAILYTSHKLDEVARIADRITVLRDGHVVLSQPADGLSEDAMAAAMVGREMEDLYPAKRQRVPGTPVLEVENLTVPGVVQEASFTLAKGEILGFAGLVGAGRTELMEGIVGLRQTHGSVRVNGQPLRPGSVDAAKRAGLVYLTEDRKERGLLLNKSLKDNLTLLALDKFTHGLIDRKGEEAALDNAIKEFDIRTPSRDIAAGNLSGGNQQKLLIAKTMLADPDIVIIDEPTRGIDIGTKQQIYDFIHHLAEKGHSVIFISSEMPEVIGLAERVVVMRSGRIAGELTGSDINEQAIVRLAMGLKDTPTEMAEA